MAEPLDSSRCAPECPAEYHYHVRAQLPDGTSAPLGTYVIEPYPEPGVRWELWARPLPRWRCWLRRIANRESRIETNE